MNGQSGQRRESVCDDRAGQGVSAAVQQCRPLASAAVGVARGRTCSALEQGSTTFMDSVHTSADHPGLSKGATMKQAEDPSAPEPLGSPGVLL